MHEPDLFPEETAKARMEREAMEQPKRGKYHDRRGQFTDRRTAEIAAFQREISLLKKRERNTEDKLQLLQASECSPLGRNKGGEARNRIAYQVD